MVKQCVGPIDFFLALCFLSARNDIRIWQLLRRSDSNAMPKVRPVAGVPDHRASKKQTNEGLNNVRTVTSSLHSNEGITPWTR